MGGGTFLEGSAPMNHFGGSMNRWKLFTHFLSDESGQTTTEYVLILAVIVTIIMQMKKKVSGIVTKILNDIDTGTDGLFPDGDSAASE